MVSWLETSHRTRWKYPPKISNLAGAACYNHDPEHRRKFVWSSGNQFCFCLLLGLKMVYDIIDICPNMPLAGQKHYNQPPNWQTIHICKSYLTYYLYIYIHIYTHFVFVFIHDWTVYSVWTVHISWYIAYCFLRISLVLVCRERCWSASNQCNHPPHWKYI